MKYLLVLSLTALCCYASGQTYISFAPAITNNAGIFADRTNIALEVGRQWDVFSLGLDIGKTTLAPVHGVDTTTYLEIRPNLNIFQVGKFTNTFTAGVGYIFRAEENVMTEVTSGIEYAWTEQLHINIVFGQYYYSGTYSASNVTFFGVSAMYYLNPNRAKSLIKN